MADPVYRYRVMERAEYLAPGDLLEVDHGKFVEIASCRKVGDDVLCAPSDGAPPVTLNARTLVRFLRPDDAPKRYGDYE